MILLVPELSEQVWPPVLNQPHPGHAAVSGRHCARARATSAATEELGRPLRRRRDYFRRGV